MSEDPVDDPPPLGLFEAYGIELEYMIVDRETLAVRPICDELLRAVAGAYVTDVEEGPVAWSNELVLHVVELKTNGPAATLAGLAAAFQADVVRIDGLLAPLGARLLPTAMHPLMDPATETRLWPHDYAPVYRAYDRIFGCRGHGWSNLQAAHLNLPFAGDEEFGRLHAAIRAVLPLLPALAAASPVVEGVVTGALDSRLEVYRTNQIRIPEAAGRIVPEPVFTRADYDGQILQPLYRAIAPHDPDAVLQHEFLNSRGAIARFERDAIEIRLLDVQECPAADLAVAHIVTETVRALCEERWVGQEDLRALAVEPLLAVLVETIRDGDHAVVAHRPLLRALGIDDETLPAGEIWRRLAGRVAPAGPAGAPELGDVLRRMLAAGPLARRMLTALGPDPGRDRVTDVYRELADCLHRGTLFRA